MNRLIRLLATLRDWPCGCGYTNPDHHLICTTCGNHKPS